MSVQPIDQFCKELKPEIKEALTKASIGSTVARQQSLDQAYPEPGKALHLRELANAIKSVNLADNLEKAVSSLERNNVKVLFAKDADEARKIILDIIKKKDAKNVVKVKSMTTEEIELNAFLGKHGINAVETDLVPGVTGTFMRAGNSYDFYPLYARH